MIFTTAFTVPHKCTIVSRSVERLTANALISCWGNKNGFKFVIRNNTKEFQLLSIKCKYQAVVVKKLPEDNQFSSTKWAKTVTQNYM